MNGTVSAPDLSDGDRKRILVPCHEIVAAGGLYRFDHVGRVIRQFGHHLAFVAFGEPSPWSRPTEFPVLRFEEAAQTQWDATMVPGAGFPADTISRLAEFNSPGFGLRVQHILNDQTRKSSFLNVNGTFKPDIVVCNNRHWQMEDFADFQARAIYFLEGAVDFEGLAAEPRRYDPLGPLPFVVGGLTNKNVEPLIEAVRTCGGGVQLHLFGETGDLAAHGLARCQRLRLAGVLDQSNLRSFYGSVDCVVSTETFAGWSNLAAEAMASGVPVVCTSHGTAAFAEHEVTALLVPDPTPNALAEAIQRLQYDPVLANRLACNAQQRIQRFSWKSYSSDLLRLLSP